MKTRIEAVTSKGSVSEELKNQHKGFLEWNSNVTKQNHQPIVQVNTYIFHLVKILEHWFSLRHFFSFVFTSLLCFQIAIDGRDTNAVDSDGCRLPALVYMAREKRPDFPHHFKAGAMNALVIHSYVLV